MGTRAHDCWRDAGVFFGYGLPNEQWGTRAAVLGWERSFPLRWLVRVLRPERILGRRLQSRALGRMSLLGAAARRIAGSAKVDPELQVLDIGEITDDFDAIASAAVKGDVSLVRGSAFVDYRYLRCPSADYRVIMARHESEPVGYAAFCLRGDPPNKAVISEIVVVPRHRHVVSTLVAEIERRCLVQGIETIFMLAVPGSPDDRILRRCGFVPRRAAFSVQYVPFQAAAHGLGGGTNWKVHGGDFDVV